MKPCHLLIGLVKKTPKISTAYLYQGERGVNPAYCDSEHCPPLSPGEKRIWALRSNLILALGIKNAYVELGNTNLFDRVEQYAPHGLINHDNRYGHPSLTVPDEEYDGSVYSAGWLYQHEHHIQLFLCSGRFYHNPPLPTLQQHYLERYLSMRFMEAYGEQDIVFIDYDDRDDIETFLNGTLAHNRTTRIYTPESIKNKTLLDLAVEYGDHLEADHLRQAGLTNTAELKQDGLNSKATKTGLSFFANKAPNSDVENHKTMPQNSSDI